MPVERLLTPHPATLPLEVFETVVDFRFQRRSGPGGQHRNKVSTGAFATHTPTGVVGEGTETRSRETNRKRAIERLRMRLAIAYRTRSPIDARGSGPEPNESLPVVAPETDVRDEATRRGLRIAEGTWLDAATVAMLLNDMHAAGGQPSIVARHWSISTSRILRHLRRQAAAWQYLQTIRMHHGRRSLG